MTAPGWYPDPNDPKRLRLWNGSAWTDQTTAALEETPGTPHRGGQWRVPALLTALGLAVVTVAATVVTSGTGQPTTSVTTEVVLQAVGDPGPDPFGPSVAAANPPVTAGGLSEVSPRPGTLQRIDGSTPGLYGGTGNPALCDLDGLAAFLADDADRATAVANVVGVAPEDLDSWLTSLTPVLLREDTRVTNHGYRDGQAVPFQAVLQAGTAIAVDVLGVPRIRCECGNPLADPAAVAAEFTGPAWESFTSDRLATVGPAQVPIESFTLTDVATGTPIGRRPGRLFEVSDTIVAGVPFGTSEPAAIDQLISVLGTPTYTSRTTCIDDRYERVYYYWDSFGVRFELGQLDAWVASEPSLLRFRSEISDGGLPPQLAFGPLTPAMTVAEMDVALARAVARDPDSWIGQASDTGVGFSLLSDSWERSVGRLRLRGEPLIDTSLTGNSPDAQLSTVIVYGQFTPAGAPANAVCFGSDAPF